MLNKPKVHVFVLLECRILKLNNEEQELYVIRIRGGFQVKFAESSSASSLFGSSSSAGTLRPSAIVSPREC